MRARRKAWIGSGLAAIAAGVIGAGCFGGPPPSGGPAQLSANPSTLVFNAQANGAMPTLPVTVTNIGGHPVRSLAASNVGVYSLPQPASNPCQGPGAAAALAPGQSCVIDVMFCPTTVGPDIKTLVVTGVDATSGAAVLLDVTLNGTAT